MFGGSCGAHDEGGTPTKAVCPSTQTLTYESFGKGFMQKYCTRCHSVTVKGASRAGAPTDHNLDTVAEIRGLAEHVDGYAAAGPTVVNKAMPPGEPRPTDEERRQLGEWLACGAP